MKCYNADGGFSSENPRTHKNISKILQSMTNKMLILYNIFNQSKSSELSPGVVINHTVIVIAIDKLA